MTAPVPRQIIRAFLDHIENPSIPVLLAETPDGGGASVIGEPFDPKPFNDEIEIEFARVYGNRPKGRMTVRELKRYLDNSDQDRDIKFVHFHKFHHASESRFEPVGIYSTEFFGEECVVIAMNLIYER